MSLSALKDGVYAHRKFDCSEVKVFYLALEVFSLNGFVQLQMRLSLYRNSSRRGGRKLRVLLSPGHGVEYAVSDGVDGIDSVAVDFVVAF